MQEAVRATATSAIGARIHPPAKTDGKCAIIPLYRGWPPSVERTRLRHEIANNREKYREKSEKGVVEATL